MTFIIESWFWRGTQSAIFYYISCTPCMDYTYKRKRRKEASRAEKQRAEIVITEPGLIAQPGPFQTNEAWGEEMVAGPGPPKGWKTDKMVEVVKQKMRSEKRTPNTGEESKMEMTNVVQEDRSERPTQDISEAHVNGATPSGSPDTISVSAVGDLPPLHHLKEVSPPSTPSASTEPTKNRRDSTDSRPTGMRKMSSTYVAMKDTLRSSLHPEKWNWKRYEREDEALWGINERINRIWDRATGQATSDPAENRGRKRAGTTESDQYDYKRARNPEINELHPPVVSQLPATREEAAWMLMGPPSRAVMEGKEKPNPAAMMRWPLARIGRTAEEEKVMKQETARNQEMARSAKSTPKMQSARPSSRGKERAVPVVEDPYAASESSLEDDEETSSIEVPEKENVPPVPTDYFPLQHRSGDLSLPGPAGGIGTDQRKSWSESSTPVLISRSDGTNSPSQRWSFGGIWVA